MNATAQQPNKKVRDNAWKKDIMLNECTRAGILGLEEMKTAYDREYAKYTVDSILLKEIKPLLKGKTITIVMGTWCGDSRFQVPHFYKIADQLSFPEENIRLIAVDGHKKAENGLIDGLNIQKVPTFIVYENGKETGRIIERPAVTLEKDLLTLLSVKE
jgi:thiol-disulfide isomerase/thioredoxin